MPGFKIVSIPAGLLQMRFAKFLAFTFLGSCGWSMLLTILGYYFGGWNLPIYDVVFVSLARDLGVELKTFDKRQAEIFKG